MKTLIRIDKNGTKYWHDDTCSHCGGSGYLREYAHVENGVCFKCGGSGIGSQKYIEYTPEYAKVLEERRIAKFEKERLEALKTSEPRRAEWLRNNAFSSSGKTYLPLGNTYSIKEELKLLGGKYSPIVGWHLAERPEKYPCIELSSELLLSIDYRGDYSWNSGYGEYGSMFGHVNERKADASNQMAEAINSSFVGEVGEKLEVEVTLVYQTTFETHITEWISNTVYLYKFEDKDHNVLVWKASRCQDLETGATLTIKGSIKDHKEYNGENQTILTRCKVL